ncbi:MAG: electron transport complex subunit RsxC [Gammaproteobacteria bacterium]|nr:electron transport complex subunit RsxC [Gammaproteobacteria bacterium]
MNGRKLWHFHGGLKLDGHKPISMQSTVEPLPIPPQLVIPLQQHIGAPAEPVVSVGDKVKKGQVIAEMQATVSAPVHAPTSGTVTAIEERSIPHPSGMSAACIVIDTDGKDEWLDDRKGHSQYHLLDPEELRILIRNAGIVGLGGAGFPSYLKLQPGAGKIVNTLILNGAECEPWITCDAMLMQNRARDIIDGLNIMRHAVHAGECLIGVEDNKPEAISALRDALSEDEKQYIDVVAIPTIYPTGGEKQLIKVLTGKEIPSHKLPIDIGVVCHNVGTAAAVADAVIRGIPLISRYVTVTGTAVAKPHNLHALFGTPMDFLLQQCEPQEDKLARLIMGGPMMGFEINDRQTPIIKTTNCLLTMQQQDITDDQPVQPCIRCGQCAEACPAQLLPQQLYWWSKAKDFDKVQDYNVFDCIECGCCALVCPSHIPLVQYYRFAKTEIWQQERDKQKSDRARERHEFRQYRMELKKKEDEERRRKKKELLKKTQGDKKEDDKKSAIEEAMARVAAKKEQQSAAPKNTEELTPAQQKQIAEADARRERINKDEPES